MNEVKDQTQSILQEAKWQENAITDEAIGTTNNSSSPT
jgi:hypothetical protein